MTFDLILNSLSYHGREWFVFQDILTHLPPEKAAIASHRSKTTSKYTYRFGLTKDWVVGESKKVLVDNHFIDSNDAGRNLIFSSVLIDAERMEELFHESFTKKFRLKVQQFQLTSLNDLSFSWFEWHFDPKQKDVKKFSLDKNEGQPSLRSKGRDKTPQKDIQDNFENGTTNLPPQLTRSPLSLKRRRATTENENLEENQQGEFAPNVSESILARPEKKAKDENSVNNHDDKPGAPHKTESVSSNVKPELNNLTDIKQSISPMQKLGIKLSPSSSPQTIVKDDVMLSCATVKDNHADSDTDYVLNDAPLESNMNCQNSLNNNGDDVLQDAMVLGDEDISNVGNILNDTKGLGDGNNPDYGNSSDVTNSLDGHKSPDDGKGSVGAPSLDVHNSLDDDNASNSNILDDGDSVTQNEHGRATSPTSSLLNNSENILENIKLQEQQLCNEEEVIVIDSESSGVASTSSDTRLNTVPHKHDCGAEACSSNSASSTVCLCKNQEDFKNKPSGSVGSAGLAYPSILLLIMIEFGEKRTLLTVNCLYQVL